MRLFQAFVAQSTSTLSRVRVDSSMWSLSHPESLHPPMIKVADDACTAVHVSARPGAHCLEVLSCLSTRLPILFSLVSSYRTTSYPTHPLFLPLSSLMLAVSNATWPYVVCIFCVLAYSCTCFAFSFIISIPRIILKFDRYHAIVVDTCT